MLRNPYEYQTTATIVDNGQEEAEVKELRFNVEEDRIKKLKLGILRKAEEGSIPAICTFLAHFMVDERGRYMARAAAFEILDEIEVGDLEETMTSVKASMGEAIVPKASGGTST